MYLSRLYIDIGNDPTRERPGRLWLRNLYHVHQRLCMAFPSAERMSDDQHFLKPFKPEDFGKGQVHVERAEGAGFLFRIDPHPDGRVVILVQSAAEPNWDYAFQNAGYLLAAPPEVKEFNPNFNSGQQLRFRIRANLSKKKKTSATGVDLTKRGMGTDKMGRPKQQSKRVALTWAQGQNPEDVIRDWFARQGKRGFDVNIFRASQIGWGNGYRPTHGPEGESANSADRLKFRSALLEGTLTVTNVDTFKETVVRGIGSGKAFGFGLLSVAPIERDG